MLAVAGGGGSADVVGIPSSHHTVRYSSTVNTLKRYREYGKTPELRLS